ncbi:TolC family protein [Dysgonomonas sp. ZJ709]|uniref:TolC family protein n=1 Tax=Dysgonomonas sp. ZJ709 TaxID=2709797 RepID=UPI002102E1FC|nr:TolC family protein [Dysgonomonas sp. ZJ709]
MKRFTYIILFLTLNPIHFVMAQDAYKLSVEELFDRGVQNSIAIQASYVKTQLSDDKLSLAKNKQLPDLAIAGVFGYVGTPTILDKDLTFLGHPASPDWRQNYQVIAVQPIYQGGRITNSIEKAKLEQEVAQLSLQKNKADLKLWLMTKYLDLFNLYKKREVYGKNVEEAKVRVHDIEKMKEEGMITTNDVLRSKLLLTDFELAYNETNDNISLVSQQLTIVLGMDENLILMPDESLLTSQLDIRNENDYVSLAYSRYPDIQITRTNMALAKNNLKLTKADLLPSLSLQASNTLARPIPNTSPVQDFYLNGWGVTLNLSYHISAWFDRKRNVSSAKREIQLQELAEEQQMQTIRADVKSAVVKHKEALDRIKAFNESVKQANENYRIVKNRYFNQLAILTDLLDANSVQLDAELQLTAAKTNAIYTYYQLQNVSGSL